MLLYVYISSYALVFPPPDSSLCLQCLCQTKG
uniref:Uncharacterized protein n=1 Tax=Anguilla anguilla TaxID=7936 RepID=A0A0E9PT34_ANGAN